MKKNISVKKALGQSCLLVGMMTILLSVVLGIKAIIDFGLDRLIPMGVLLSFSVPTVLIGWYLIRSVDVNVKPCKLE